VIRTSLRLSFCLAVLAACGARAADEEPAPKFEGAVGAVLTYRNEYLGGSEHKADLGPAFYLRCKRLSISHASGFVTRRQEELPLGLGLELVRRDEVRMNLGLRIDRGRDSSSTSGALAGVEDVRATLRLRTGLVWQADKHWKATAGWTVDLLGRGGGSTLDAGLAYELRVGSRSTWSTGVSATWATAATCAAGTASRRRHRRSTACPSTAPAAACATSRSARRCAPSSTRSGAPSSAPASAACWGRRPTVR